MVFVGEGITNLLWEQLHFIGHDLFPCADFLLLSKGTQRECQFSALEKAVSSSLSSAHAHLNAASGFTCRRPHFRPFDKKPI